MFSKKMAMIAVLVVLVTFSILVLSVSSRRPFPTRGPGRVAIALVSPFQKIIVHVTSFINDIWENYFFLISVVDDNKRLRKELQDARALQYQYDEVSQENERLRRLLAMGSAMKRPMLAAQVVGKDPSPWFQTIVVDKGQADGVAIGFPVVNADGIVGLVVEVAGHYAKVMLITDPNSAVDAVVQRNRARGIITGGTSGYCVLNYALRKHTINVGDVVVSSGMDGVFPKGLPIGQVAEVVKQEAGIFQEVTVTPFVDVERLEEVLIVQAAPTTSENPS